MLKRLRHKIQHWHQYKAETKASSFYKYIILEIIETIVIVVPVVLLIRHYVIISSVVPTPSMVPTLNVGDRLFVNKYIYRFSTPKRGDIVVFKSTTDNKDYVKRCVALPGETVEIIKGTAYINGEPLLLPGVKILRDYDYQDPVRVPADSYFVLGDNRAQSSDSRRWGFVPENHLLGKALFTFWPFNRMRVLR